MPELPDVETSKRYLDATALHQTIERVHVEAPGLLGDLSPQGLGRMLTHHRFERTQRHGKYVFVQLETGRWLVLHFGMSGRLAYYKCEQKGAPPAQLCIDFDNGYHLAYIAPRKLGHIALTDDTGDFIAAHDLGPDALALDFEHFRKRATGRRGAVKSWLMNQQVLAGIGNIYADEILFQAGIHPQCQLTELGRDELERLFKSLREVLGEAIAAQADPARLPASFLLPQRHKGGCCPACGASLETVAVSGRTAYYCSTCQS
jgi:formamidopyrimidine-DNA glycosylase